MCGQAILFDGNIKTRSGGYFIKSFPRDQPHLCRYGEIALSAERGGSSAGSVAGSCCGLRIYLSLRYAYMAGATTLSDLASALDVRTAEAEIVAELKAGSEDAFYWLIAHYHQPVYSLVYRILDDPSDAADTTQEVFIKVFRGIKNFNADSILKTWIYRIAVHEASNHRRWWFRHKAQERSIEAVE